MSEQTKEASMPIAGTDERPVSICFFFNAQRHQMLHGISTAVALARMSGVTVHVASPSPDHIAYARMLADRLGGAPIRYDVLSPALLTAMRRMTGASVPPKLVSLGLLARQLNRFDAIAVPERTSILLRRMGVHAPKFIHLDHGAGDRAAGFDPRIALFDMVLMAGEKHRERLFREGLIREGAHAVVGYPKFDAADAIRDSAWRPFVNTRPTVLYNPHFSELGSWEMFGLPVIRAFVAQDRYNLIVAPHVRMFDGTKKRERWAEMSREFAGCAHILLDAGSDRSIDMSYTALADIYMGDVSSQVYEFLRMPKPCLFLDGHDVDWRDDENYGHWRFGPVIRSPDAIIAAVDAACAAHGDYAAIQAEGFDQTFATGARPPSERAAAAIAGYLCRERAVAAVPAQAMPLRRRMGRVAALAIAMGAGWLLHDAKTIFSEPAMAESAFVERVVRSHETTQIRAWMKSQPEARDFDPAEIRRAIGVNMPSVPQGWQINDVQIYPSTLGPIAHLAVTTDRGERLSFVGMRLDTPGGPTPTLANRRGDEVAYWEEGDHAFALVGKVPAARLLSLASGLANEL